MVKGYQKRVVFMKNTGSEFFDEAYFVVCDAYMDKNEEDMISEANRIIDEAECGFHNRRGKGRMLYAALSFVAGSFITALSALIYGAIV